MTGKNDRTKPAASAAPREEEDFAALLAASEGAAPRRRKIEVGDRVQGRVVAITQSSAFVAVGSKGEAMIDLAEFRDPQTGALQLAVGDQIEASVTDDGSQSGSIVIKRTLGRGGHVSAELEQAFAHGIPVEGVVTAENKGGFDVQIGGVRAFCPASQIDRRRGEAVEYIGQRLHFRITEITAGGRNVVVSRRQLLEDEAAVLATETWRRLHVGAVVRGTVTSIRNFGAFVDLGGIEGLLHVSELGHARVGHASDVLTVGQEIEVQVVKLDPPGEPGVRRQIGLSLRALAPDPWQDARERFAVGATVRGVVRRLEPFGAFVEIAPGIDGLVHVSRMALDRRVSHPRQVANPGDEVDVTILSVDPEKRRIALSMVEQARQARDSTTANERAEVSAALSQQRDDGPLGTLGQLLSTSKGDRAD